jgi:hypothetical protein
MWKIGVLVLVLLGFALDSIYLRGKGAEREAVGAMMSVDKVVGLHVTDQHLLNEEVVREFAKKAPVMIFNYRPGRVIEHVKRDDIKNLFIDEETYENFRRSFVGWSLAEFDVNDISIKEGNVYGSKVTRSFSVGVGKKMWYSKARLVVMNRALGKSAIEVHPVDVVLVFRSPEEGLGVYKLDVY